jgi:hypothetical protein
LSLKELFETGENIRECTPFGSLIVMSHISALASGLDEFQQIGIELIFVGIR